MTDVDKHFMRDPDDLKTIVIWGRMFEEHGCIACTSKENIHAGYGFCLPCAKDRLAKWEETKRESGIE